MHAELCPVCEGSGRWWDPETNQVRTCHGCGGLGWVMVLDEPPRSGEEDGEEPRADSTSSTGDVKTFHFPWR